MRLKFIPRELERRIVGRGNDRGLGVITRLCREYDGWIAYSNSSRCMVVYEKSRSNVRPYTVFTGDAAIVVDEEVV